MEQQTDGIRSLGHHKVSSVKYKKKVSPVSVDLIVHELVVCVSSLYVAAKIEDRGFRHTNGTGISSWRIQHVATGAHSQILYGLNTQFLKKASRLIVIPIPSVTPSMISADGEVASA